MSTKTAAAQAAEATEAAPVDDTAYLNERVEVRLFKDDKLYKEDYVVAVNGKVWQIQRGKTVKVPRYVANLIDSSQRQDLYAAQLAEEMAGGSTFA